MPIIKTELTIPVFKFECDGKACTDFGQGMLWPGLDDARNEQSAIASANRSGWREAGGKWYCATCWQKETKEF